MTLDEVLSRFDGVKRSGGSQFMARCPCHDDRSQSLSIGAGQKGVVIKCHAGCDTHDIIAAVGLKARDLFYEERPTKPQERPKPKFEREHIYPGGKVKKAVFRFPDGSKTMSWRHLEGSKWEKGRGNNPHQLYIPGSIDATMLIVEGEKDADTLSRMGWPVASGENGAGHDKWLPEYTEQLKDCSSICIFPDNDRVGKEYAQETAAALSAVCQNVTIADLTTVWPEIPEHGDISDLLAHVGEEEAQTVVVTLIGSAIPYKACSEHEESVQSSNNYRLQVISASDLQRADLPPVKFIITDILPEGTSLLSAASKIGKSWMMLDLGLSVAAGRPFMGHPTNKTGVLYLALEDSYNRLQDRMNKVLAGQPAPPNFYFSTEAPNLDNGLLETLDEHLKQFQDTTLTIIDTLQKIRGQSKPREPAYAQDYREMGIVKDFMAKRGCSVLFVHHNRKMQDDSDPFNMISGTNGIMGAADTIWTITKDKRADGRAVLHITGRDVIQSDTVIEFQKGTYQWATIGAENDIAAQIAKAQYEQNPIVTTIRALLEKSPDHRWDGTCTELMEAGKEIAHTFIAPTTHKLGHELKVLEHPLFENDGIVHAAPSNGSGGKKHHFYFQNLDQFEELSINEPVPWS